MKKSEKIQGEIEKTEEKIALLQTRIKELQRDKAEAVDAELLNMVKMINCQPHELQAILKAIKNGDLDYLVEHMEKQEKTA
ncbi:DUF4315 family protein (plasmid) [Oscillospiraceae bacterium PP1C4]